MNFQIHLIPNTFPQHALNALHKEGTSKCLKTLRSGSEFLLGPSYVTFLSPRERCEGFKIGDVLQRDFCVSFLRCICQH